MEYKEIAELESRLERAQRICRKIQAVECILELLANEGFASIELRFEDKIGYYALAMSKAIREQIVKELNEKRAELEKELKEL